MAEAIQFLPIRTTDRILRTGNTFGHGSLRESRMPYVPANVNHGPHGLGFRSNSCPHGEKFRAAFPLSHSVVAHGSRSRTEM